MKNKKVIDKYTQPLYIPNNLYICKNYTQKDLDKLFYVGDNKSITTVADMDDYQALTISGAYEVDTKNACIVILINTEATNEDNEYDIINLCSHEAFHVAHRILDLCGVTLSDDSCESFAFITGWAASCMYKTIKK